MRDVNRNWELGVVKISVLGIEEGAMEMMEDGELASVLMQRKRTSMQRKRT